MTALAGRLFQMIGLLLLPIGLSIGFFRDDGQLEVRLMFIGAAFFVVGWFLSRKK